MSSSAVPLFSNKPGIEWYGGAVWRDGAGQVIGKSQKSNTGHEVAANRRGDGWVFEVWAPRTVRPEDYPVRSTLGRVLPPNSRATHSDRPGVGHVSLGIFADLPAARAAAEEDVVRWPAGGDAPLWAEMEGAR